MLNCANSLSSCFARLLYHASLPGLWSRSLGTGLCAERGGVGGIPDPPSSVKRKSGCCEPGTFQLTQEFFVGRKADQVTLPFLGPWQGQREDVTQLDGMRQCSKPGCPQSPSSSWGWGKGDTVRRRAQVNCTAFPKWLSVAILLWKQVGIVGKLCAHASSIHHMTGAQPFLATELGSW